MTKLSDYIEHNRERITDDWAHSLQSNSASHALDRETLIDSLRAFLNELVNNLRAEGPLIRRTADRPESAIAKTHGAQRFALGYDLPGVLREYGTLRDVIEEGLKRDAVEIDAREMAALTTFIIGGIADAATQYGLDRDQRLREETAKHIGFLAHELRNPLGSALLTLSLAERKGQLPDARWTHRLRQSLLRASQLLDKAVGEVRLRAPRPPADEALSLSELLQEVVEEARLQSELRDQTVSLTLDPELEMWGDRHLIHSAVSNLIRNAVKFSKERGAIEVRARATESRVTIEVEDACGGLPDDAPGKMFDPFVQMGADRSGLGLGLAIAKQAVEAHSGSIRVHNLPGKGCVFLLDMPKKARSIDPKA